MSGQELVRVERTGRTHAHYLTGVPIVPEPCPDPAPGTATDPAQPTTPLGVSMGTVTVDRDAARTGSTSERKCLGLKDPQGQYRKSRGRDVGNPRPATLTMDEWPVSPLGSRCVRTTTTVKNLVSGDALPGGRVRDPRGMAPRGGLDSRSLGSHRDTPSRVQREERPVSRRPWLLASGDCFLLHLIASTIRTFTVEDLDAHLVCTGVS